LKGAVKMATLLPLKNAKLEQSCFANAQHIKIHPQKRIDPDQQWKFLESSAVAIHRLWWHTKAYATVLGIMLLTFASLGFLYIHSSGRTLLSGRQNKK
jgi:hypothetical protein